MRVCVLMPWGRVGSNLMMSYLGTCLTGRLSSEPFNQITEKNAQLDWLQSFFKAADKKSDRCVKLSIRSLARLNPVQEFLNTHDVRVIRMFRRNHLKTAISQIRAEHYARLTETVNGKAQWGVLRGASPLPPIHIDIETLAHRMGIIMADQEDLEAMYFRTHLDVYYEDLNTDMATQFRQVSKFLERPFNEAFHSPFRKATPDNLKNAVKNFSDIQTWLSASAFPQSFLDPVS